MKLLANNTSARFDDGTVWPIPSEAAKDIEWQLRYGDPVKVRFLAASIVSAYHELIRLPVRSRNARVRDLRAAAMSDGTAVGSRNRESVE